MAIWSVDGETPKKDVREQRINAGTVGGEHVLTSTLGGRQVRSIIDDSDPRILYGFAPGYGATLENLTNVATSDFQYGGTYTVIGGTAGTGTPGDAAQLRFNGTSIAVLGGFNPSSGNMRVWIDGVETKGRIPIYTGFRLSSGSQNIITATSTTVPALAGALNFAAVGTIYISGELIPYTSRDANGFYGCTRGAQAVAHNANETIYQWDSSIGLYSASYASKQILYYNPLLSQGEHTITIIAETNSTSGNAEIYFDGFVVGSLLGASNVFTQLATLTISVTTDGNGHADLGGITASNNDIARLAFIGMTQSNTESTNATTMCKLGIKYVGNQPQYYVHNGPLSASFTITLTFAFIGETI